MSQTPAETNFVSRRELRMREEAERRASRGLRFPTITKQHRSAAPAVKPVPAASTVGAGSIAFRGSDGSAVRALKRRRAVAASSLGSVALAGSAAAAILLAANPDGAAAAEDIVTASSQEQQISAETVSADLSASAGDKDSGTQQALGAPSAQGAEAEAASRSVTKTILPGCDGEASSEGESNGQIPEDDLCKIGIDNHELRADAAVSFAEMNAAYKADTGEDLVVTDSYRSLESQIDVAGRKPGLAAKPGTSLHGWGIAVDLGTSQQELDWLNANAGDYGWENPDWAKSSKYEPWHWEYVPARTEIEGS